jgi:hypothetical protein
LKVAPMSYKKLEAIADGVRPYLPTESRDGQRWSVNAQRILEDTLSRAGFAFHVADDTELQQCAAFAVPEENLVVVRQDVYDGLFTDDVFSRSTIVHELSHIVLRHAVTLHRGASVGAHEFYEDASGRRTR